MNTVLLNYIFYSWNYSVTLDSDKQQNRNILPFVLIYVFPKRWKQNSDVCIWNYIADVPLSEIAALEEEKKSYNIAGSFVHESLDSISWK